MSPEEDRTRDTVDSEPMHYQLSYSGPSDWDEDDRDQNGWSQRTRLIDDQFTVRIGVNTDLDVAEVS